MKTCLCTLVLVGGISLAAVEQPSMSRPAGLDGIAVVQNPVADPLRYYALKRKAHALMEGDRFSEAEPLADELAKTYPIDGDNWLMDARAKRKLGKFNEAAEAYQRAQELLGPGVPGRAQYWHASSLADAGRTVEALDTVQQLVDADHYLHRPSLYEDDAFKALRDQSRFSAISGRIADPRWSRDEGWAHDVDYLVAEVVRVNPDFHDRPLPAAFQRLHGELRDGVSKLSDEQIYVGMSRMLASLNQGHTNLWPFIPASKMAFKVLPLQFYMFPEGTFVVAADTANQDLIGARLVKIEDTPAADVLRKIRAIHAADSGMEIAWFGPMLLTLAQELKGLGIVRSVDRIGVTLRSPSGASVSRTLNTVAFTKPSKLLAAPGREAPIAFRHVDKPHWFEPLPEASAMYVQVNQIADDAGESLEAFGLRLRKALADRNISNLILDLRNNNGGNTFLYVELAKTLIGFSAEAGRTLYVIIGRNVYSAAANFVADLERLASPVFVGEPSAMTGNAYGDESAVVLPYSGIWAGVTGVKWQLGYPYDLRRAVVPQIPVALTAADYFAGRDPVVDTIMSLCSHGSRRRDETSAGQGSARMPD